MEANNKFWLYYEENYHEAAENSAPVTDQTLYLNIRDAAKKIIEAVKLYELDGFVADKEREYPTVDNVMAELVKNEMYSIILFYKCQENWDYSFSINVKSIKAQ